MPVHDESRAMVHGSDTVAEAHLYLIARLTPVAMAPFPIYEHQVTADPTSSFALPQMDSHNKAIFGPCASREKA